MKIVFGEENLCFAGSGEIADTCPADYTLAHGQVPYGLCERDTRLPGIGRAKPANDTGIRIT